MHYDNYFQKSLHPWQFILESNELFLRFINTLPTNDSLHEVSLLNIYKILSDEYDSYRKEINEYTAAYKSMTISDQQFYKKCVKATNDMMATIKQYSKNI